MSDVRKAYEKWAEPFWQKRVPTLPEAFAAGAAWAFERAAERCLAVAPTHDSTPLAGELRAELERVGVDMAAKMVASLQSHVCAAAVRAEAERCKA